MNPILFREHLPLYVFSYVLFLPHLFLYHSYAFGSSIGLNSLLPTSSLLKRG